MVNPIKKILTVSFTLLITCSVFVEKNCLAAKNDSSPLTHNTFEAPAVNGNAQALYLDTPTSELLKLLDDPENRISNQFKIPDGLKPLVSFWFQIYSKYSLYHTLIYDKDQQDMIYEVVDGREFFQKGLSPIPLEISIKNRINKSLSAYKQAFEVLQKNPKAKFKEGTAGSRILKLWGRKKSSEWKVRQLALRTQAGQRNKIMDGLINAERFFPSMEMIFKKYGIPQEITRLPLVESSFNLQAISKVDAVGIWQFLERSASEYLVVDSFNKIDERLSPIKSTYAAAKMFKRNYKLLDDWGLAIIAYNHGAKNLLPIKNKYKGENISKLLSKTTKTPLGYASRNFFAEFTAVLYAERYKDKIYNIHFKTAPDAISIVKIKKPSSVFQIATTYNISIHELRVFNPDIFDLKRKLPAGTRIVLPKKHGESIVESPKIAHKRRSIASEVVYLEYIK